MNSLFNAIYFYYNYNYSLFILMLNIVMQSFLWSLIRYDVELKVTSLQSILDLITPHVKAL